MPNEETQQQTTEERTFTQAELDSIVVKRVAAATKGMPKADELSAFRAWQETRESEENRVAEMQKALDTASADLAAARAEIEQNKRERLLLAKGISADDVDYYAFKIGKLVTDSVDFETAAEQFFAEKNTAKRSVTVDFSGSVGGQQRSLTANESMNALIRGARK